MYIGQKVNLLTDFLKALVYTVLVEPYLIPATMGLIMEIVGYKYGVEGFAETLLGEEGEEIEVTTGAYFKMVVRQSRLYETLNESHIEIFFRCTNPTQHERLAKAELRLEALIREHGFCIRK